jgi:general secretion pathway protein I
MMGALSRQMFARRVFARRSGERGFALLEILVAFVILALGLGAISTGVVVAMRSDARSQVSRTALRVAQSRLEAAGIAEALAPGYREGLIANKYRWRQTVTEVRPTTDKRQPQGAQPAPANGALKSFWVEIAVEAPDGTATKLAALKLATEARP